MLTGIILSALMFAAEAVVLDPLTHVSSQPLTLHYNPALPIYDACNHHSQ